MSPVLERTFKSKITVVVIVLFMILLVGCGLMSLMIYKGTTATQKYFEGEVISSTFNDIQKQYDVNNRLLKKVNSKSYTLQHAYVEVNPYNNSPLSGIIIFQTRDEEQIRVYINNEYVTTMESSKKHIIPIYGLYSDKDNIVKVESSSESCEYTLHTDKVEGNNIKSSRSILFDLSKNITGYDTEGNVRFYIDKLYSNDMNFLSNGHFITGLNQGVYNNHYNGFVEMDYLGKIYNYYYLKEGYTGGISVLPNGNLITLGLVNNEYIIYTMDPRNGEVVSRIDFYGLIKAIDNNIDDKIITSETVYNNINLYYGFLLISNDDTGFLIDINDNKLVSVYSNNEAFKKDVWNDYYDESLKDKMVSEVHNTKLYDEVTPNININSFKVINNIDKEELSESNYKKINLNDSEEWKNTLVFTDNILLTDYDFSDKDVKLYLVNRAGKIYILDYLKKDSRKNNRIYNLNIPVGQYVLFIKVDDTLYKTSNIYQF